MKAQCLKYINGPIYSLSLPPTLVRHRRSPALLCSPASPQGSPGQRLDEGEYVTVGAYTVEEIKEKIYAGEIEDSKTIAAVLAYTDKYAPEGM